MKKLYENPELEVIMLKEEDIVRTSGENAPPSKKDASSDASQVGDPFAKSL